MDEAEECVSLPQKPFGTSIVTGIHSRYRNRFQVDT
jgi:hypothetical protein